MSQQISVLEGYNASPFDGFGKHRRKGKFHGAKRNKGICVIKAMKRGLGKKAARKACGVHAR